MSRFAFAALVSAVALAAPMAAAPALADVPTAENAAAFGPAVGSIAPAINLPDQRGNPRTLGNVSAQNGAVVVFVRSADWCPVCVSQLKDLAAQEAAFAQRGYNVVAITTDTAEKLGAAADRRDLIITMLADADRSVIRAFGVVDPAFAAREEGHRFFALPFPSTFILSPSGEVKAKLFEIELYGQDRGYAERVTPQAVLDAIDALPQPN